MYPKNHPLRLATFAPLLLAAFIASFSGCSDRSAKPEKSDVYYTLDLSSPSVREILRSKGVDVVDEGPNGEACLQMIVPANPDTPADQLGKMVSFPVDVAPLRGAKIAITALARGDNISVPAKPYLGLKCQLFYNSPTKGKKYIDEGNVHGTFPWREIGAMANVDDDAAEGSLSVGMQGCSGTMWLTNVRIRIVQPKVVRPAPVASLTQKATRFRGVMSPGRFEAQDFKDLADWNVNCIRWQLGGPKENLERYDEWLDAKLDELALVLDAAQANGIKVVVDLHLPPGGRLPDGTLRMVVEKKYQDQFVALWERIARRFKDHPALWAYDLINEPVQNRFSPAGVDNWLGIQVRAAKAVRAIDSKTPIMIETDQWDGPAPYAMMQPVDVPNVIYQVHMYFPGEFTHQGVHTDQGITKDKNLKVASIAYPGMIADKWTDKEALRRCLEPVREFQLAYNARIFVGEFSAIRWAPGAAQYLDDCISLFEEYGWDWTYHAFREWPGWSVEHANLPYDRNNHPRATEPTDRFLVLQKWFKNNKPAAEDRP